jgi:phosphoglycolate phosphatase-like HAD superfamily hydrolase
MIRLIIFDWDDVFTMGATKAYVRCYHEAMAAVGVHLPLDEEQRRILQNWGQTAREELRGLLTERPDLIEEALCRYEQILMGDSFVDCLSIVPGSVELLMDLQRHYTLTIATGINPRLLEEKIMPRFGIPPVFAQIVSVYDTQDPAKAKPNPYMVETILGKQGVSAAEAVLIGDARGDVLMARAVGVLPIVVLTGHLTREQAVELDVRYIIPDVTHLTEVLPQLS